MLLRRGLESARMGRACPAAAPSPMGRALDCLSPRWAAPRGGARGAAPRGGRGACSEKEKKASSTPRDSQAVPHPSTNRALRCLTAEFGRDPVFSTRYGRWHFAPFYRGAGARLRGPRSFPTAPAP